MLKLQHFLSAVYRFGSKLLSGGCHVRPYLLCWRGFLPWHNYKREMKCGFSPNSVIYKSLTSRRRAIYRDKVSPIKQNARQRQIKSDTLTDRWARRTVQEDRGFCQVSCESPRPTQKPAFAQKHKLKDEKNRMGLFEECYWSSSIKRCH